jgi:hypothetical protein
MSKADKLTASKTKFFISEVISERNSQFQLYCAEISNLEDARTAYRAISLDPFAASSTHIISAYWLESEEQGYYDDHDHGLGKHLLGVMQHADMINTICFLTREYGGQHLGFRRFEIVSELVDDIFDKVQNQQKPSLLNIFKKKKHSNTANTINLLETQDSNSTNGMHLYQEDVSQGLKDFAKTNPDLNLQQTRQNEEATVNNTPIDPITSTPRPMSILEHFKAQHGYDYYPEPESAPSEPDDDNWNIARGKGQVKRGIRSNSGRGHEGHRGRGYYANRGRGLDTNRDRGYDANRGYRGRGYGNTRGRGLGSRTRGLDNTRGRGSNYTETGQPTRSRGRDWGSKTRGTTNSSRAGSSRTKPTGPLPPPLPPYLKQDCNLVNSAPHGGARSKNSSVQAKVTAWLKTKTGDNPNYPSGQPKNNNKPRRNSIHGFYNEHDKTILVQPDKSTNKTTPPEPTTKGNPDGNAANIDNQKVTTQANNLTATTASGNSTTPKDTPITGGDDTKAAPMDTTQHVTT